MAAAAPRRGRYASVALMRPSDIASCCEVRGAGASLVLMAGPALGVSEISMLAGLLAARAWARGLLGIQRRGAVTDALWQWPGG